MSEPIYKFFMGRLLEPWYQLSKEEQESTAVIQNRMETGQELCSEPYSFDLTAPHESCSETPGREERHVTAER
jgi:hypothetical protein